MEKSSLPPIYNKILFWQRWVWLVLVIVCMCYVFELAQNFQSFSYIEEGNFKMYIPYFSLSFFSWIGLIALVVQLRKTIKIGAAYENKREAGEFGRWINSLKKTWLYFLVIILLMIVSNLLEQLVFVNNLL